MTTSRCPATTKRTGNPCGNPAGFGTDHVGHGLCKYHGGNTPGGRKQGARLAAEQLVAREVGQILDDLGVTNKHPLEAILEALDQAGTMVAVLRALVAGLDLTSDFEIDHNEKGDPHYRVTKAGFTGPLPTGAAAPNIYVAMYGEWLDRYAKLAKTALDAGIDERRTQLAESTTNRLFTAVDAALGTLPADQREVFRVALADQLRALPA